MLTKKKNLSENIDLHFRVSLYKPKNHNSRQAT